MKISFAPIVGLLFGLASLLQGSLMIMALPGSVQAAPSCPGWVSRGPKWINDEKGIMAENVPNHRMAGAVDRMVIVRGTSTAYVGGVNGGVWRSNNFRDAIPHYEPLTDHLSCLSVSALAVDEHGRRIVAACGDPSNYGISGCWDGAMVSLDAGKTWTQVPLPPFSGRTLPQSPVVTDIVLYEPATIVLSVQLCFGGNCDGVWRSENNGANWTQTMTSSVYGLAGVFDSQDMWAVGFVANGNGAVFFSADQGKTWTERSNGLDRGTPSLARTDMGRVSVHAAAGNVVVYAGFYRHPTHNYSIWYSEDKGLNWHTMNEPITFDKGERMSLGEQGITNFALLADPHDPNLVYVGGQANIPDGFFGGKTYSGRLFRGSRLTTPAVWTSIVLRGFTASASSPHADSRRLIYDPNDDRLFLTCDGGIYYRTGPKGSSGDWFVASGDLVLAEIHSLVYDFRTKSLIGGAQDIGTLVMDPYADGSGNSYYVGLGGDGATCNIDDQQGESFVYMSAEYMEDLKLISLPRWSASRREIYWEDVLGKPLPWAPKDLDEEFYFYPRWQLNAINKRRILLCGVDSCHETSFFTPKQWIQKTTGYFGVYRFGGMLNGQGFEEVYLGLSAGTVWRKDANVDEIIGKEIWYSYYLALDPTNYHRAYATGFHSLTQLNHVWESLDFGKTWQSITGDLAVQQQCIGSGASYGVPALVGMKPVTVIPLSSSPAVTAILVGTGRGVYATLAPTDRTGFGSNLTFTWHKLGGYVSTDLPNTIIEDMVYSFEHDTLFVSCLGRGIWSLANVRPLLHTLLSTGAVSQPSAPRVFEAAQQSPASFASASSAQELEFSQAPRQHTRARKKRYAEAVPSSFTHAATNLASLTSSPTSSFITAAAAAADPVTSWCDQSVSPDICEYWNCGVSGFCADGDCVCVGGFYGASCSIAPNAGMVQPPSSAAMLSPSALVYALLAIAIAWTLFA